MNKKKETPPRPKDNHRATRPYRLKRQYFQAIGKVFFTEIDDHAAEKNFGGTRAPTMQGKKRGTHLRRDSTKELFSTTQKPDQKVAHSTLDPMSVSQKLSYPTMSHCSQAGSF